MGVRAYNSGGHPRLRTWGNAAVVVGLLVLPACNQIYGLDETKIRPLLDQGLPPRNYAILCDIERKAEPRRCATADEINSGMFVPRPNAAIALTVRHTGAGNTSLDYSEDARAACGGLPQVVTYMGPFPEGLPICVKYLDVIGPGRPYANPNGVCRAWCNDLHGNEAGGNQEIDAFCDANARASTSFPIADEDVKLFGLGGYLGACTAEGVVNPEYDSDGPFIDPRRLPEPVEWDPATFVGVSSPAAGSLVRTAPTTTAADAGAAAAGQLIRHGDGYLEFTATETTTRRIVGLAVGTAPNATANIAHLNYAIELRADATVRVLELGVVKFTLASYGAGQVFRINVTDNHDESATITYSRLTGSCLPGTVCPSQVFYTHTGPASYPLHVDSALATQGATLTNVRLVRIRSAKEIE